MAGTEFACCTASLKVAKFPLFRIWNISDDASQRAEDPITDFLGNNAHILTGRAPWYLIGWNIFLVPSWELGTFSFVRWLSNLGYVEHEKRVDPPQGEAKETRAALELIEVLLRKVSQPSPTSMNDAIRRIAIHLGADGGEMGLMSEVGKPKVFCSYGDLGEITDFQAMSTFYTQFWGRADMVGQIHTIVYDSERRFACCSLVKSEREILGTTVWGTADSKFEDLTILRIFLRLVGDSLAAIRKSYNFVRVPQTAATQEFPPGYLAGSSPQILSLHREIELLSEGAVPVMLIGETGVGKEHMARLIHLWSPRKSGPFKAVNCAAIPGDLLEAEMFGIGKGVATGVQEREGYFQAAHRGTLFLDEISEMDLRLQAKLLRALQNGEVQKVGASSSHVDVRVVSATNSNLLELMNRKRFRPDLYYRLAGFILEVPPLRHRLEDLTMLIEYFMRVFGLETGKTIPGLADETLGSLMSYGWSGNVRELEHEIRRLIYLCPDGQEVGPELLSQHIRRRRVPAEPRSGKVLRLEVHHDEAERTLIIEALTRTRGNKTKAAQLLGISRNGLSMKMNRLGVAGDADYVRQHWLP
jgi:DNA-binding NtrC family response regulator